MTIKQTTQAPIQVTVSDPNNVPETVLSGPINVSIGPEVSIIICTSLRPNIDKLMKGQIDPNPQAVVNFKGLIPTSQLRGLHAYLGQGLAQLDAVLQAGSAAPNGGMVAPGGQSNH